MQIVKKENMNVIRNWSERTPNSSMITKVEKKVNIVFQPKINFSYDIMAVGVFMHLDRIYTYDTVPEVLNGGYLFQGIHRTPKGTSIKIEVFQPCRIYFIFNSRVDGGYSAIFKNLKEWELCEVAPQYDLQHGDHGENMTMYRLIPVAGTYVVPSSTGEDGCISIVYMPL